MRGELGDIRSRQLKYTAICDTKHGGSACYDVRRGSSWTEVSRRGLVHVTDRNVMSRGFQEAAIDYESVVLRFTCAASVVSCRCPRPLPPACRRPRTVRSAGRHIQGTSEFCLETGLGCRDARIFSHGIPTTGGTRRFQRHQMCAAALGYDVVAGTRCRDA